MSPLPDEKFSAFLQPSTAGLISWEEIVQITGKHTLNIHIFKVFKLECLKAFPRILNVCKKHVFCLYLNNSLSRSESVLSDLYFFCCSITRSYLICFFLRDRKLNLSNAALSIEDGFDEVVTFCAMTPQKALDARMWKMF